MGWDNTNLSPAPGGATEVVITDDGGNEVSLATQASLALISANASLPTSTPGEWSITSFPAVNTVASFTRAAVGGMRHIARCFVADLVGGTVAPGAIEVIAVLRDGVSGTGTVIIARQMALEAIAGDQDHTLIGPANIVGTQGNAMTVEFTNAGGANTFESISLTGYDAT